MSRSELDVALDSKQARDGAVATASGTLLHSGMVQLSADSTAALC